MKFTTQRLKQIIKEEIEKLEQPDDSQGEADRMSMSAMRDKLLELYKAWPAMQGISVSEIDVFNAIIDSALEIMTAGEASPILTRALKRLEQAM